MTPGEPWLATLWPLIRARLPAPPARVVDIGCGPLGGFVPMLRADGYDAVGIDPQAPEQSHYQRLEFERAELLPQVDVVVASTSLHHVADPTDVIDRITSTLTNSGTVVIVEWAWEKFDEQTATWCFERLGPDDGGGWLHRRRDEWLASGREWPSTSAIGRNATGFILGRCCSGSWTNDSSADISRVGLTSFPIFPTRLRPTSKPRSMLP